MNKGISTFTISECCPICLSSLSKIKRKLPCGHLFCFNCIYEWENMNNTCPLCRQCLGKSFIKWPIRCICCNSVNCDKNHTEINHSYVIEYCFN